MKRLSDFTRSELEDLVSHVVCVLWTDSPSEDDSTVLGFAPGLEWTQESIEMIAEYFNGRDLKPDTPSDPATAVRQYEAWLESGLQCGACG